MNDRQLVNFNLFALSPLATGTRNVQYLYLCTETRKTEDEVSLVVIFKILKGSQTKVRFCSKYNILWPKGINKTKCVDKKYTEKSFSIDVRNSNLYTRDIYYAAYVI